MAVAGASSATASAASSHLVLHLVGEAVDGDERLSWPCRSVEDQPSSRHAHTVSPSVAGAAR
jgi:hypothetical protein